MNVDASGAAMVDSKYLGAVKGRTLSITGSALSRPRF